MPLVATAELVAAAAKRGSGVAAFNVITLEHAEGIVAGAQRMSALRSSCRSARTPWRSTARCAR